MGEGADVNGIKSGKTSASMNAITGAELLERIATEKQHEAKDRDAGPVRTVAQARNERIADEVEAHKGYFSDRGMMPCPKCGQPMSKIRGGAKVCMECGLLRKARRTRGGIGRGGYTQGNEEVV